MPDDAHINALLRRSSILGLLARLLREPADPADWRTLDAGCAEALDHEGTGDDPDAPLRAALQRISDLLAGGDVEAAFRRTFGHVPAGTFSPYETSYGGPNAFSQSQTMADIRGYYTAFGVEPAAPYRERPDHLGAELEFLAFVLYKEALAHADGNTEGAEICTAARRRFVEEHVGLWGPVVLTRLERDAPVELYRCAGTLGRLVLEAEVAACGATGPATELGAPPPAGIVEDYCPELFETPDTPCSAPVEG